MFRKSVCPFVQTRMYLPESPFFNNSLAGASTYVGACNVNGFASYFVLGRFSVFLDLCRAQ